MTIDGSYFLPEILFMIAGYLLGVFVKLLWNIYWFRQTHKSQLLRYHLKPLLLNAFSLHTAFGIK